MPKATQLRNGGSKKKSSSFIVKVCLQMPTCSPSFLVLILWLPGSSDAKKLSPHLREPTLYSSRKQTHTYTDPTTHISQMHVHIPTGICTHLHTCIRTHTFIQTHTYLHTPHIQTHTHTHTHTRTYPSHAYAHTPHMYHTYVVPPSLAQTWLSPLKSYHVG